MNKVGNVTQWLRELVIAVIQVLLVAGIFLAFLRVYHSCTDPEPVPASVDSWPDPRPQAAYEHLAPEVEANRHNVLSAHEKIEAMRWQFWTVMRTCPGQKAPPPPRNGERDRQEVCLRQLRSPVAQRWVLLRRMRRY